jgi:hypothetical protein
MRADTTPDRYLWHVANPEEEAQATGVEGPMAARKANRLFPEN